MVQKSLEAYTIQIEKTHEEEMEWTICWTNMYHICISTTKLFIMYNLMQPSDSFLV